MLDSDVDALLDIAVSNFFVDNHTDSTLRYVVNDTGLSVCRILLGMCISGFEDDSSIR